jgi:hypothetical protein
VEVESPLTDSGGRLSAQDGMPRQTGSSPNGSSFVGAADDLAAMHEVLSDPRAMLYWSTLPHRNLDETRAWLDSMIADPPGERDDFIVEHDGRTIGKAGCWRLPRSASSCIPTSGAGDWPGGALRHRPEAVRALSISGDHRRRRSPQPCLPGAAEGTGLRETGRAARTWLIGETWCDSIYLALPRPDR